MTIAQWLFNPFVRIAGGQALAVGLAVIFASALAASAGGVHFDGLLDFHLGSSVPLQVAVMEGLVNWCHHGAPVAGLAPGRPADRPAR